ncbi:hypothetical protein SAMN04487852_10765 [Prevotella sp. tf2-5]|nr:hypothetical protein SAMN04487852_10765 [Prevotella sp. tf2-5]
MKKKDILIRKQSILMNKYMHLWMKIILISALMILLA